MAWEKVKLGEISSSIQTGPFGSQLHQSDYSSLGTPVVMPKDMIGGKVLETTIARVEEQHVKRLSRHQVKNGDILYSRRGDVGRCALITKKEVGWLCGTGCLKVSIDASKANSKFVFYQLQKPETVGWVEKHAVGATMLNLNTGILEEVPVELPNLSIQNRIVDILSAYDNLIENNQKQIKLLEEAAQRLYKEWFIDLRFPGHETTKIVDGIPTGWIEQTVSDFIFQEIGGGWGEDEVTQKSSLPAFVIRGADIDGINHGDFSNIPFRFHSESNLEQRTLQDGDIVFEVSGGSKTEGVAKTLLITDKLLEQYSSPVICASFCKKISPKEGLSQYFYDALRYMRMSGITSEYDKKSASSIVNYRWKDFLSQQHLVLPSENVLRMYDKIAKPIYKNIQTKSIEIEKLKQARDRLLPKLMSGEIEV